MGNDDLEKLSFEVLFNSADQGIALSELIYDDDGEVIDVIYRRTNACFERIGGVHNVVDRSIYDVLPGVESYWIERYKDVARTGLSVREENYQQDVDRWFDCFFARMDQGGRYVVTIFNDNTARKRAEEELFRSNTLLRTTVDNSLQIIQLFKAVRDDQGAIIDFEWLLTNKQWDDRYGSNVGKRLLNENPAVVESGIWDKFLEVMETDVPITHEHFYKHEQFDGWFLQTIAKADDGILLSTLDVTEHKQTEAALGETEQNYRMLFDCIDEGFCIIEVLFDKDNPMDYRFLEANSSFERQTGLKDAVGKRMRELQPEHEQHWFDIYGRIALTGEPQRFEARADALGHWYSVYAFRVDEPERRRVAILFNDIGERKRAEIALRESEERFRQFGQASRSAIWVRDAKTFAFEYVSPSVENIYGIMPESLMADERLLGATILPEDREEVSEKVRRISNGETIVQEYRILRASDRAFRWIRSTGFPIYENENHIQRIGAIAEDVTDARIAVEHQGVLIGELQHRVRNLMGMIRSMANRSSEGPSSIEDYRSALEGRLLALARVQALLTRGANKGGLLRSVIEAEIAAQAHHAGQYDLTGPDIMLSPKAVEVLTLAFHELATNAVKYGGLSIATGRVSVRWDTVEKRGTPWLVLDWREEGVPFRDPPTRRGFGSELIERKVPYELRGTGKVTIEQGQARCHLEIPLSDGESILETDAPTPVTIHGGSLDMTDAPDLSGKTVLVVEDDYYMASDAASALRRAGAEVLGPCPTEEMARAILATQRPSSVVVDLNLGGGGPKFEIARLLKERGIPFLFLTGYDADVVPDDMLDVPRLQKPVPMRQVVEAVGQL